jgi:hypothetical protein
MTLDEALNAVESLEFSAIVNVASTFKTFIRLLASQPATQELRELMKDAAVARQIVKRILVLCKTPCENGLEHPTDAALAAYLWLLSTTYPELATFSAAAVLQCDGCWWARQLAKITGTPRAFRTQAPYVIDTWGATGAIVRYVPVVPDQVVQAAPIMLWYHMPPTNDFEILAPSPNNRLSEFFRHGNTANRIQDLLAGAEK